MHDELTKHYENLALVNECSKKMETCYLNGRRTLRPMVDAVIGELRNLKFQIEKDISELEATTED